MKDPELLAYCERIEHEFFRLKGRPGTLSPADFERATRWYREEVPLEAALEALRVAFASHAGGRDREAEEVNGLAYCENFLGRGRPRPRRSRRLS
ncbi:MAG: hypothetical protein ACRD21_06585 [Vicinamibacteria bacterium]